MTAFVDAHRAALPDLKLPTEEIDRESHRHDETAHYEPGRPLAVSLPTSRDQVSTMMPLRPSAACRAARAPARGSPVAQPAWRRLAAMLVRVDRIVKIDRDILVAKWHMLP